LEQDTESVSTDHGVTHNLSHLWLFYLLAWGLCGTSFLCHTLCALHSTYIHISPWCLCFPSRNNAPLHLFSL